MTATSDAPFDLPAPVVTGAGAVGTMTFAPDRFADGVVTITLTLTDSGGTLDGGLDSSSQTFTVTVSTDAFDAGSAHPPMGCGCSGEGTQASGCVLWAVALLARRRKVGSARR